MVRDARGEWVHPERGLIRERNVVVFLDFQETAETQAAREPGGSRIRAAFSGQQRLGIYGCDSRH